MPTPLKKLILYIRLFWNHVTFWSFPTPEENYYTSLGTVYFELEKYGKAITAFKKSEKAHYSRDASFTRYNSYFLGYSYLNLGDFMNAVQWFEKYLKLKPEDYQVIALAGFCYEVLQEFESSLKSYSNALKMDVNSLEIYVECSKILTEVGRKEDALENLLKAETITKNTTEKEIVKAMICWVRGNLEEAIELIKKVIFEMGKGSSQISFLKEDMSVVLSRFQKEKGDSIGALTTLELALEGHSSDIWLLNEIATEYADQGIKLEKAIRLIEQALAYQPYNSIFLDTKGWILFKLGKLKEAEAMIHQSLTMNPKYKEALEHLNAIQSNPRTQTVTTS